MQVQKGGHGLVGGTACFTVNRSTLFKTLGAVAAGALCIATYRKIQGTPKGAFAATLCKLFQWQEQGLAVRSQSPAAQKPLAVLSEASWIRGSELTGAPARAARVSLSPNGTLLATVPGKEAVIQLWDVSSGTPRSVLEGHKHAVTAVAFSPSGKNLASGGKDGTVMLWDMTAATPERRATLSGHTRAITAVAWRPGGGVLASASADLTVRVWNTARGECTGSFNFRHMPEPIAWGASGGNAFTLAVGQQANVWVAETHTGERHNACTGHLGNVQGVAFSPNGATLATASSDCTVRLFDVWYGGPRFRKELVGHKAWVTAVAFSPSGHTIASASEDKTIIIWNASTGARLSTLRSHQGAIYDIAFDRSGRLLASAGTDATLLWCRPV